MLIFGIPALAVIALIVGLIYDGRAQADRDQAEADAALKMFSDNTVASSGTGALTRDPSAAATCEAAQRRAGGQRVKLEPYNEMSRDLAERFVRELC